MLGHENLLDTSCAESVERVLGGIQVHFTKAQTVPVVEFLAENRTKISVVVASLEQRRPVGDIVLADDATQGCNGAYGTQLRDLVVGSEGHLLNSFTVLDRLGVFQRNENSLHPLEVNVVNITPTDQSARVDVVVRVR